MRMAGKRTIVTGAAGGIGRAIADAFAREGASVVLADIREAPYEPLHDRQTYVRFDVVDQVAWKTLVDDLVARHGGVDVLVNNAGINVGQALDEVVLEDWQRVIAINQTGPMLGIRTVVPVMRRQGGGSIINVTSGWSVIAGDGYAAYHASKGALRMITKNAAATFARDRIRVNSIVPGIVLTPMSDVAPDITAAIAAQTPLGLAEPAQIAGGAVFLACDDSSYVTGSDLMMDGGLTIV